MTVHRRLFFVPICYRLGMDWNTAAIRHFVIFSLREDDAASDITTRTLIRPEWKCRAEIRAKQSGVVAGLPLAALFFKALDRRSSFKSKKRDGAWVKPGDVMAEIRSSARAMLAAERPALNALQHLSGIATFTHAMVRRMGRSRTQLLDTRKTLPGWRALEKYAVRCGGGHNHRMTLSDAVLVKDNHLRISRGAGGDWRDELRALRRRQPKLPVQVEVQTERDFREALELAPPMILLDNQPLPRLKQMISTLKKNYPAMKIEISGGVRAEDLPRLARLGVDRISMGRLTHSTPAFDCSLEITHVAAR